MGTQELDEGLMGHAIEAATNARTSSSPNPWVGAVVASGDRLFEGFTSPPGGPHAEIVALGAAGDAARGSALYVTLEPCAHHGRTPPCVDAIVAAGVRRVVVGVVDPDPAVSGEGLRRLADA
ncbi:MAG: deaminase, partial [Acidimicrobiales bacterium]